MREVAENAGEVKPSAVRSKPPGLGLLFLASFAALYFELVMIRYLSTEIRVFAYIQNLPLIASFLGIGLGMVLGRPPRLLKRVFPFVATFLFSITAYSTPLRLTHLPLPGKEYFMWGVPTTYFHMVAAVMRFYAVTLGIVALLVAFFTVLGGIVGEHLALHPPLPGYGVNLLGSLAGIAAFTLLAFLSLPPILWVLFGFAAILPFFLRDRLAFVYFILVIAIVGLPYPETYWSPYYRIDLYSLLPDLDSTKPSGFVLNVNHDYHQKMVDLSPAFLAQYPDAQPNKDALPTYELPYRLVPKPGEVLVVGAGTGNDVAAALRHGADHVDAVEIDPVILALGRKYHPEGPYSSPHVTIHNDDARAFFKKTKRSYDLVIFGYLDSHTLFSSFSSLRLDNYVYTVQSFQEARRLLKPDGSLVLAFASGRTFMTERVIATLTRAFDVPPRIFPTGYDGSGIVFVEGVARLGPPLPGYSEARAKPLAQIQRALVTTDRWPFLYLAGRTIPLSISSVLLLFLVGTIILLRATVSLPSLGNRRNLHFFLLGSGFLLLETKGVTELSLLFGSTWIVNAVVIGAFLLMAILANALVMRRTPPYTLAYGALFVLLGGSMVLPYSHLDALPGWEKVLASGILVGLPVFFSGLIFSRSLERVGRPSEALGVNLLGAVIGGILENTVMLAGTAILGATAILLYGLSAVCVRGPAA